MITMEEKTLGELCLRAAALYRKRTAFAMFRDGKVYGLVSYRDWGLRSWRFASLLGSLGVKPGGRVMILAENRPEWPVSYFGIALGDAVSVPVLTDFTDEQVGHIAAHAEVSAICVTGKTAPKCAGIDPAIPRIYIDSYEQIAVPLEALAGSADIQVSVGGFLSGFPWGTGTLPSPAGGPAIWLPLFTPAVPRGPARGLCSPTGT
jgi:long-chain acyl-CoA synthetase